MPAFRIRWGLRLLATTPATRFEGIHAESTYQRDARPLRIRYQLEGINMIRRQHRGFRLPFDGEGLREGWLVNATIEIAGPEPIRMDELVRQYLIANRDPRASAHSAQFWQDKGTCAGVF